MSTLFDNYGAIYLINNKGLLDKGIFRKTPNYRTDLIQAGTNDYLVVGRGTYTIKKVLRGINSPNTKDLVLYDVVVVEGFYYNIILKAYLGKTNI